MLQRNQIASWLLDTLCMARLCGYLTLPPTVYELVGHPIAKPWALSNLLFAATTEWRILQGRILECVYGNLWQFSQMSIYEFRYWCWSRRLESQSAFQFILKVLLRLRPGLWRSTTPNSSNHILTEALWTGTKSYWTFQKLEAHSCFKCLCML